MLSLFFISIAVVFYSYVGYGLLLWILTRFKKQKNWITCCEENNLPDITLIIPAYNELYVIDRKMQNTYSLDYPKEKLTIAWITDGSDDGSNKYIAMHYPNVLVWHEAMRKGKAAALNRALTLAKTELLVFCDANTMLNHLALKEIVKHFANDKVGVVAGEKRVFSSNNVAGTGENLYWKYESWIKRLNAQFFTSIGAVGELFAVRKSLVNPLPEDTIVDDFVLSMEVAYKGYIIAYEPNAYAVEEPSENEQEEMKRKVRIAAGAFQALFRYLHWLNFFKNPVLSFQYFSYKVIRWLFVPLALPLIFVINAVLIIFINDAIWLKILFLLQVIFYAIVWLNLLTKKLPRVFYVPYYFILMNVAQYLGFIKYIRKKQPAAWEKVKRKA